jgi:DNA-binding transcriptional LysR family regulator
MALRLPPLSGLRLFEAAARCGSFKRAAQELNLTPGALSHGIDSLEQWLDVELFGRKARGVILTPAGRQYLSYISEALSMIATGTLRLPSRRFEDRLSISSTSLFAYKVLLPRLHKFREMYPNMVVTVEASRQIVSLPSDQFDLAIRNSREPWPKLSCDLLGRIRFFGGGRTWPCHRPSADHRRRYRGRSACDRGRSRCSGHERLLAGQAAGPRNAPRDRRFPQLAAQGNVAAEVERPQ